MILFIEEALVLNKDFEKESHLQAHPVIRFSVAKERFWTF